MNRDLADFLDRRTPQAEESAVWGRGQARLPLRITAYLGDEIPPLPYVTSVRSLVFHDGELLVMRNLDDVHIMPGGRREEGETLEQTLRREVLEETGWTLRPPAMLGFMRFHHLSPRPPDYPYPHPDFIQVIYTTEADIYAPEAKLPDDYEIDSGFRPFDAVQTLTLTPCQRLYLSIALQRRGTGYSP